ncbi:hypothetical protein [Streptomyces sp. NPDC058463]|uniref:hypothetical protein n=1 Tax=Streptomyces sp. NPDC058463 TaxID=3346510 RepID=UPI0036536A7E
MSDSAAEFIERGQQAAMKGDWKAAATAWIAGSNAGSLESANLVLTTIPLKTQADDGDADSQALLAGALLDFVDDSGLPMALTSATAAARAGHPTAQRALGVMYRTGRGVEGTRTKPRCSSQRLSGPVTHTPLSTWRACTSQAMPR